VAEESVPDASAPEQSHADIYAMLDAWCGERFDTAVASRLVGMPLEQAESLWHAYRDWAEGQCVPQVTPGESRPYLPRLSALDFGLLSDSFVSDRFTRQIRATLLYAHGIAVQELLWSNLRGSDLLG
jgi:hypothetical protein